MAPFHEFFCVKVECEVATLRNPVDRREFDDWCIQRVMKECEVLGYDFDEWRYYAELLKRDPEGPGIMLQPVLLRYGYPWPELAEL